jgi:hypothetical protein
MIAFNNMKKKSLNMKTPFLLKSENIKIPRQGLMSEGFSRVGNL